LATGTTVSRVVDGCAGAGTGAADGADNAVGDTTPGEGCEPTLGQPKRQKARQIDRGTVRRWRLNAGPFASRR